MACLLGVSLCVVGCSEEVEPRSEVKVHAPSTGKGDIFGADDRDERFLFDGDQQIEPMAQASAALVNAFDLGSISDDAWIFFGELSLQDKYGLCDGERFASQPSVPFCSATLVAPDLVVTSGHCLGAEGVTAASARCGDVMIVFDYAYTDSEEQRSLPFRDIPSSNVYRCTKVEAIGWEREPINQDWAVLRLDRDVEGRAPSPILDEPELAVGRGLVQIGHPSGLPQKIVVSMVTEPSYPGVQYEGNTFAYDADIFGGNSGGGVFDLESSSLAGIPTAYSGMNYALDRDLGCYKAGVCADNVNCVHAPGAYSTHAMLNRLRADLPEIIGELSITRTPE